MSDRYGSSGYTYTTESAPPGLKILAVFYALTAAVTPLLTTPLLASAPLLYYALVGLSVLQFAVAVNLWQLKQWAWTAAVVLQTLTVLLGLLAGNFIGVAVGVFILSYLAAARRHFSDTDY